MAKRFLFVCAGLLCLALSYHLGARNATAQAPSGSVTAMAYTGASYQTCLVATTSGDLFEWSNGWQSRGNVFGGNSGGRTVVEMDGEMGATFRFFALASDGEVFALANNAPPYSFVSIGYPVGGPTPVQQESWGAVKSRYRQQQDAAQPAPQGR